MTPKTTKDALLKQVADLKDAVSSMKESLSVHANVEHMVSCLDLHRSKVDLHHVDQMREHMRRQVAHFITDELLRSGSIKFSETLEDDYRRYCKVLRIEGSLQVC